MAPYGEPKYVNLIKDKLIDIKEDGTFHLNMNYFSYHTGLKMTNNKFNKLFGGEARKSESTITNKEMDIAASIQKVTEEVVVKIATSIKKESKLNNLCLAGGVALNCVANGVLNKKKIFDNIWIQPAAGDAGGAIGAALCAYYDKTKTTRKVFKNKDKMSGSYLGPYFSDYEVSEILDSLEAKYEELDENMLLKESATALANGKAIGWMQGRMEFGPRSLGNRSIIADPRSSSMQKLLNLKIKFRESFRPFAPSVLIDDAKDWFELDKESPYMLLVSKINKDKIITMSSDDKKLFGINKLNIKRSSIPAVTHVDYSARIQTVSFDDNPMYYNLIKEFKAITSCPVLVNTSFNVRGEPIVCTPEDAFRCFMGTELDILVIGNKILKKEKQKQNLKNSYIEKYELD